jgi:hypothetical protein
MISFFKTPRLEPAKVACAFFLIEKLQGGFSIFIYLLTVRRLEKQADKVFGTAEFSVIFATLSMRMFDTFLCAISLVSIRYSFLAVIQLPVALARS